MADSTLAAIRNKVRRLTGSPNTSQLSDSDLDDYIDVYYEQDLPASMKLWNLHRVHSFYTVPNEDRYALDVEEFYSIDRPIYIDGFESFYTQEREEFFRLYPRIMFEQTGPAGDGTAGPYTMTFTNTPFLRRDVVLSAVDAGGTTRTMIDDGNGTIINSDPDIAAPVASGTVNYTTGVVANLQFRDANDNVVFIPTTESIIARYVPYVASRPDALLFFEDFMFLRPVPDKAYKVDVEVYQRPTQLLSSNPGAIPDIDQWWQLIAFGAARKVLQDRLDNESLASIEPFYQEQMNLVMYRTATQLANQRTATIYTEQLQYPIGNRGFQSFP